MDWKAAHRSTITERRPAGKGWLLIDDVARKLGLSLAHTRLSVRRMIAAGLVERASGTCKVGVSHVSVCVYYRLKSGKTGTKPR